MERLSLEKGRDPGQFGADTVGHALTIGVYDGVHVGHQAVIRATRAEAERLGVKTAVVTFEPHPAYVLRPESAPRLLTDLDQKLDLLEEFGVDTAVVVPFDHDAAQETAQAFVERVVVGCLQARSVVVGSDFHFGKDRVGNVDLLTKLGELHGFGVEGITLLSRPNDASAVSSTAIRRALADGDVTSAAKLLGRLHEVRGTVVMGDQRGRQLGFPTANVAVEPRLALPADAVYAGWYLRPDGTRWPAAVNIGKRPTFYQDAQYSLVEAHLIDFEGDLYDEPARVQLVDQLRSEVKFDGIDALISQLRQDVKRARTLLDEQT